MNSIAYTYDLGESYWTTYYRSGISLTAWWNSWIDRLIRRDREQCFHYNELRKRRAMVPYLPNVVSESYH